MKVTCQILLFVELFCGYDFQQPSTPSAKWAFAQSYSWVISNNGYNGFNNFDPSTQQSQEQARLQQQLLQQQAIQQQELIQQAKNQQQAQIQQAIQQQALQLRARQDQIQEGIKNQALQEALWKQANTQALQQQQLQQQARENIPLQGQQQEFGLNQHNSPSSPKVTYTVPHEFDGHGQPSSNLQTVPNFSSRRNDYTQEFIDEIVRKVVQEARGEFALPTTKDDIEKIVRKILFENSSNSPISNRMNRYLGDVPNVINNPNPYETYSNRNGLSETFNPQKSITHPVIAPEQFNPQAECLFNCGNSQRDGPIAVAMANSIYSLNRAPDPRMVANSFSYTSV